MRPAGEDRPPRRSDAAHSVPPEGRTAASLIIDKFDRIAPDPASEDLHFGAELDADGMWRGAGELGIDPDGSGSETYPRANTTIRLRVDGEWLLAECNLALGERLQRSGPRGGEDLTVPCAHVVMGC